MPLFGKKKAAESKATSTAASEVSSDSKPASVDGEKGRDSLNHAGEQPAGAGEEAQDDESRYPQKMKLVLITIALCLAVFCVALDNTIISTAIPRITDDFNAIDDVGWYGSSYLLTTCAFQLFYGKLYQFLNIKWIFLAAILIFEIGSAVCGAAPNSDALIIGRAVAGLGSSGIFSGALLIIANTVPLRRRPAYFGLVGGMYGLASVAGPLMGGAFTDKVSWRWCFYINLPIGAITLLFVSIFYHPLPRNEPKEKLTLGQKLQRFDLIGTAVFLPMIVCLLLALQWGGTTYAWNNGRIIALFVLFGVLLIAFVSIQFWKGDDATVPPRIMKQRSVAAGSFFAFCLGSAFFIFVYYLPIWFQAIKGVSAVHSGIDNIPMILGLVVISIFVGGAVTTTGWYTPFVIGASVFMAIGSGLLTTLGTDAGHSKWIGYQVVFGAGVGMGMQQTIIAVQTVLPERDIAIGTSIIMFSQLLGGALFISVAENIFENTLLANTLRVVPNLDPDLVTSTGATSLASAIPAQYLPLVKVAYNGAIRQAFVVAVAMASLSILGSAALEWKNCKGKKIEMAAA